MGRGYVMVGRTTSVRLVLAKWALISSECIPSQLGVSLFRRASDIVGVTLNYLLIVDFLDHLMKDHHSPVRRKALYVIRRPLRRTWNAQSERLSLRYQLLNNHIW